MKNLSIIGSCIFLFGIIIFGTTLALCGWDFANLSTRDPFEEKRYSIENSGQSIILNDHDTSVLVDVSPDEFIHLIYFERDKEYYNIYNTDEIKVQKQRDYKWYDEIFVMDFQFPSFTILLPAQFSGDLDVKTSNAKVTVSNTYIRGKLKLATSNNAMYLNQISALDIYAQTTNGKINADSISSAQNMSLITTNNYIKIRDVFAEDDIELATSNGKISGTIKGLMNDYSIVSKTTNSKNNLPESSIGGNKKFYVSTTNAEIMIRFIN